VQPSVHVYNASLAACERVGRIELALELLQSMHREVRCVLAIQASVGG
jgi:pentatricopeptide repeat protein